MVQTVRMAKMALMDQRVPLVRLVRWVRMDLLVTILRASSRCT